MAQITKRKDSYTIRVSCGYSADGKKHITQSMTWKPPKPNMTPKQIEKALNQAAYEFEEKCSSGQAVNSEKFETFCEKWFEVYAERALKRSNIELCKRYTPRVYEKLGHLRIDRITPREIDSFITWLSKQQKISEMRALANKSFNAAMNAQKLNQKQLAIKAGVSPHTVGQAQSGEYIRRSSADKIAAAMNAKTSELFTLAKSDCRISPKTVKNYVSFVSSVFDYAVHTRIIKENPCRNATLPKVKKADLKMFTLEEAKRFLDILETPETPVKYRAFFQLAIFGGFRRGEILGLEWNDIDFEKRIVHIQRTVHYSRECGYYDTEPKSKSSVRSLQLPENIFFSIKQLMNEQNSQRLKLGDMWNDTSRLFTTWNGQQMSGSAPTAWLTKICKAHGLPKVNLHSFRHLNASLLISQGVDVKTVQSVLGHSQASTTLDIYAAAFREREAQALGAVAAVLNDRIIKNA